MNFQSICAAILLFAAAESFAFNPATALAGQDLTANNAIAGMSPALLTQRWWQWASSFEYEASPVSDQTGERCGAGQEGPVWFLAGTYGSAPAKRTCTVPADKHLFFPLINYIVMPGMCRQCGCKQMMLTAKEMTDQPMGLFVEVDGRALDKGEWRRVASSDCFNAAARVSGSPHIPAASDGYWMALKPLPKGRHTVRFGGSLPSLRQELIYTLIVE